MNLAFKKKFDDGVLTHFHDKIIMSVDPLYLPIGSSPDGIEKKYHTFRFTDRWRVGMKIHMWDRMRSPFQTQFNANIPQLEYCTKVDEFDMCIGENGELKLLINGRMIDEREMEIVANNDGLTLIRFVNWFTNALLKTENFEASGQIIHWTNEIEY